MPPTNSRFPHPIKTDSLLQNNLSGMQYVGKTKNTIVKRFGTHFYNIEKKHDSMVARHFNDHGFTKDPPLQIHVLEFIHRNRATNEHEKMWMGRLNTFYPKGLNIQDCLFPENPSCPPMVICVHMAPRNPKSRPAIPLY